MSKLAPQCLSQSRAVIKDHFVSQLVWHDILAAHQAPEILASLLDWVQDRLRVAYLASTLD